MAVLKNLPPSAPLPSPSQFLSLPAEIHTHISSYLDKTSVIELCRVVRSLHHLATIDLLWHRITFAIPEAWGQCPLIQPYEKSSQDLHTEWSNTIALADEQRKQSAVREKGRTILKRGGEKEWRRVREMCVAPDAGGVPVMIQALDLASANLESLTILAKRYSKFADCCIPMGYETLDFKLFGSRLFFPNLVHLKFQTRSINADLINHLICLAPNLSTLMVDFDRYPCSQADASVDLPDAPLLAVTKLRRIRFELNPCDEDENMAAATTLQEIVSCSSQLSQLNLHSYEYPDKQLAAEAMGRIVTGLAEASSLHDLRWPTGPNYLQTALTSRPPGFHTLRRLVLQAASWIDALTVIPTLPSMEEIYYDASLLDALPKAAFTGTTVEVVARVIDPALAQQLRANSKLHIVHTLIQSIDNRDLEAFTRLDDLIERDEVSGRVYSLRHGDAELIHLRLLRDIVEVADLSWPIVGSFTDTSIQIQYQARDGTERAKIFVSLPAPAWHDFTHYEDRVVPLSVIEDMRRTEGASKADWEKRGVEVGDAAWKVLTDWHASL